MYRYINAALLLSVVVTIYIIIAYIYKPNIVPNLVEICTIFMLGVAAEQTGQSLLALLVLLVAYACYLIPVLRSESNNNSAVLNKAEIISLFVASEA